MIFSKILVAFILIFTLGGCKPKSINELINELDINNGNYSINTNLKLDKYLMQYEIDYKVDSPYLEIMDAGDFILGYTYLPEYENKVH